MQVCEQLWTEGCIWIAVESLKNSSLGIVSSAGKILITWRLSEQPPTTQIAALTLAKKRKKDPLLRGGCQSLHRPQVNMMPIMWPLLSPLEPLLSSSAPISAHSSAVALELACGISVSDLCQKCLWKRSADLGFLIHHPAPFQSKGLDLKGD